MADDAPQLLTVPEVAKIIRCSPRTVRERIEAGVIKAIRPIAANGRPSSRWLVLRSALDEYLGVSVALTPPKEPGPPHGLLEARRQAARAKLGWLPQQQHGRRGSRRTLAPS
ncbi:MAG: helix-turn-helix domain-containing protein [Planctomycetes bacterium]|nr:helix-turn-helix domain-containing protein [Planctomycetota bacterium]